MGFDIKTNQKLKEYEHEHEQICQPLYRTRNSSKHREAAFLPMPALL